MSQECDCAAATEGKWADVHSPGCASIQARDIAAEDQQIIADLLTLNKQLRAALKIALVWMPTTDATQHNELASARKLVADAIEK